MNNGSLGIIMKIFGISTWGGGTPDYLVAAETKERAWKLVEEEWRKKFCSYCVGGNIYNSDRQTIDNLLELDIPWISATAEGIIDIHEALHP